MIRFIISIGVVTVLAGCKLAVIAPAEGDIYATFGSGNCSAGNVCTITINSGTYSEYFTAVPRPGYEFVEWQSGDGFVCGGSTDPNCAVTLTGDALSQAIVGSDQTFYAMPLFAASDSEVLVFRDYVSADEDDAEEDMDSVGDVTLYSNDLDFRGGSYNSFSRQRIGLRFTGSEVPAGAVITRAYISFVTDGGGNTIDLELQIWAEADDTGTFTSLDSNIGNRGKTSESAYWSFTPNPLEGVVLTTPDLKHIVQEVIDDPDWDAPLGEEDDMTFIFEPMGDGFGHQEVYSRDGAEQFGVRPMLHIEYTVGGAP